MEASIASWSSLLPGGLDKGPNCSTWSRAGSLWVAELQLGKPHPFTAPPSLPVANLGGGFCALLLRAVVYHAERQRPVLETFTSQPPLCSGSGSLRTRDHKRSQDFSVCDTSFHQYPPAVPLSAQEWPLVPDSLWESDKLFL